MSAGQPLVQIRSGGWRRGKGEGGTNVPCELKGYLLVSAGVLLGAKGDDPGVLELVEDGSIQRAQFVHPIALVPRKGEADGQIQPASWRRHDGTQVDLEGAREEDLHLLVPRFVAATDTEGDALEASGLGLVALFCPAGQLRHGDKGA